MIPKPGDPAHTVPVPETFHEQTDELTEAEIKQMEGDNQAIQTILLVLPEDIYYAVDSCETTQEICLLGSTMMRFWILEFKRKRLSCLMNGKDLLLLIGNRLSLTIIDPTTAMNMATCANGQIAQPGINMGQDRQMQMVRGNGGNQFRQYVGKNVGNQHRYNAVHNVWNQVVQNEVQNRGYSECLGNQIGYCLFRGIAISIKREWCYNFRGLEEAGIQIQDEEFDLMAAAGDLDEIEEVNANYILMANLQQASTSGTQTNQISRL
ncbi:hypothetical protein Tco_0746066 [Tanacetum coccineum]